MPTTSRYILELNGAPSVSSTNNSVVNIPGIAGTGSNVAIDLDTLGTSTGSAGGCEFDYACISVLNNCVDRVSQAGCDADINNFYSLFENYAIVSSVSEVTNTYSGVGGGTGCHMVISGYECSALNFANPTGNVYFQNSSGNPITATSATTTLPTPGTTQGITFTCGTDSSINYAYNNFDVTLQNSCANHDQSFLLFTPQASATGDQSLGGSTNTDNSINLPFHINNIQSQNGDFYIEPFCDTDGMGRDILVSVLDNTILV